MWTALDGSSNWEPLSCSTKCCRKLYSKRHYSHQFNSSTSNQMNKVNSLEFFKPLWFCWIIVGIARDKIKIKTLYFIYSIVMNVCITFIYPLHLLMFTFRSDTIADNFKNLAPTVTVVACVLKFIVFTIKLNKVKEAERLLKVLDGRAKTDEEIMHFETVHRGVRNIVYAFLSVYLPVAVAAELSFLFKTERSLLYPAWFPFDWRNSTWKFYLTHFYQIFGLSYLLIQNYAQDTFPPVALCLLSGHVKLLGLRAAKIGHQNDATWEQNELELKHCIADHKQLYKLFDIIQDIISLPMFIQFTVTALNICVAIVALLFYVTAPMDILYNCLYFVGLPLQIFPTCYYGSSFEYLLEQLHYDIYASNWPDQSRRYKKHMQLFTDRSLKRTTALAAGWIRIHLDTFFVTIKAAYSLFTVIVKFRK